MDAKEALAALETLRAAWEASAPGNTAEAGADATGAMIVVRDQNGRLLVNDSCLIPDQASSMERAIETLCLLNVPPQAR